MHGIRAASRRWLVFGIAAVAAAGLASSAIAQSSPSHVAAPMTPISTTTAMASSTSTAPSTPVELTPSSSASVPSASQTISGNTSPTPNAPPTGSGSTFSGRSSDAWFFGGSIVAMFAIALVGGWLSVGRRR